MGASLGPPSAGPILDFAHARLTPDGQSVIVQVVERGKASMEYTYTIEKIRRGVEACRVRPDGVRDAWAPDTSAMAKFDGFLAAFDRLTAARAAEQAANRESAVPKVPPAPPPEPPKPAQYATYQELQAARAAGREPPAEEAPEDEEEAEPVAEPARKPAARKRAPRKPSARTKK